ncbi:hypothetical protein UFOVP59_51 [uncultured Caudovirales phage]|uniref:Uncharacterized protein n=1 Tax=uncultured Caudovirales phage TaxID=2100421 RepID=A0A6J5KQZ4_9CAUD|nr:hypothetical protein UFOVP59_51 [uncultured Caudovirales phage]CAB5220974.1 hypothetical protein UFOVP246_64 [uncultured Caudovirales phage]
MIREHNKDFEFEYKDMLIEFSIDYNLYGFNDVRGYGVEADDIKYSNYTIYGNLDAFGKEYTDNRIKEIFGEDFLKELDRIASDMVEEAQLN